jgi:hypothetical protein
VDDLTIAKRLHYFDYQFLRKDDFVAEQDYHVAQRRLHNRVMHTWGVASGLDLNFKDTAVTISPGVAIDSLGREIVVPGQHTIDLANHPPNQTRYITIAYEEALTDVSPDDDKVKNATRSTEQAHFEAIAGPPGDPGRQLVLGIVRRANKNIASVELSDRHTAGVTGGSLEVRELVLSDPDKFLPEHWVRMHLKAPDQAALDGALQISKQLSVDKDARIDGELVATTADIAKGLKVGGELRLRGTLVANSILTDGGKVSGPLEVTGLLTASSISVGGGLTVTGATLCAGLTAATLLVSGQATVQSLQASSGPIVPANGNSASAGIQFPPNPGGGSGDQAFIRYFAETGEATKLQIGVANEQDDRIGFVQFGSERLTIAKGNVGIGTQDPMRLLHVEGAEIHVGGATGGLSFADRSAGAFVSNPTTGQRWVWYSDGGEARLWSGKTLLTVTPMGVLATGGDYKCGGDIELSASRKIHGAGPLNVASEGILSLSSLAGISMILGGPNAPGLTVSGKAEITGGCVIDGVLTTVGTYKCSGGMEVPDGRKIVGAGTLTIDSGSQTVLATRLGVRIPEPTLSSRNSLVVEGGASLTGGTTVSGLFTIYNGFTVYDGCTINHGCTIHQGCTINGGLTVNGGKNAYVTDHFVNNLDDALEQGDVVVVNATGTVAHYGNANQIPVPEVDLTDRAYDTRVCGIVDTVHGELEAVKPAGKPRSRKKVLQPRIFDAGERAEHDPEKVTPGQVGAFVTLGAYAFCKVDASIAPIEAGDLLTTSPTKGHAQKLLDREKATGAIIGKALGPLAKGKGKIPVLVTLH